MKKEPKNESHNAPELCPSCGHCPTCGRSNGWYQRAPYIYPWPHWYYGPNITYTPSVTYGTYSGTGASGRVSGTTTNHTVGTAYTMASAS